MINHWMFRCKDVSRLISRSMDEDLGVWTRFGIGFHLRMCLFCRRYDAQLRMISTALSTIEKGTHAQERPTPLPREAAQKIQAHLNGLMDA